MPNTTGLSRLMSSLSSVLRLGELPRANSISSTQPANDTDKKKAADHVDRDIKLCFREILDIHDDIKRSIPETTLSSIKGEDGKGSLISHLKDALNNFVKSFGLLGCDAHSAGADRRNVSTSPLLKRARTDAGPTPQPPVARGPDVHNGMTKCQDGIRKLDDLVARLNNKIEELPDDDPAKGDLVAARDAAVGLLHQFQSLLAALSAAVEQQKQHHAEGHQDALIGHLARQDTITA